MTTLETITKEERELCDELALAIKESPIYGKYRHDDHALSTNPRKGSATICLDARCLRVADGRIKMNVCKAIDDILPKLEQSLSTSAHKNITVHRWIKDESNCVTFTMLPYHIPQTIEIDRDFAKDSLSITARAIIRFAEVIASLYKMCSTFGTYAVTFSNINACGKTINRSTTYGIRTYAESKENFEAYAIAESARLIRECIDETSYDAFIPNYAEITASDTKDVYKVKF